MAKFSELIVPKDKLVGYVYYCPGCECDHAVYTKETDWNKVIWEFDGNLESPTVSPSIHIQMAKNHCCHLFIRNGKIEFLSDCTHKLAGKTVDMEDQGVR